MHIFVLSLLIVLDPATASKSRSVNLELETVLEFDKSNDIDFLKTVQQFIDKVKDTLTNDTEPNEENDYKFTDLLEKSIEIIKTFQDDEIRNVFKAIDDEVKKFNPKNNFENNIRRYLTDKLVNIKRSPIKNIHKNLDDLLRKLREDNKERNDNFFINFVNTLYKKDSERKYVKLFNKLDVFRRSSRRSNEELKKIIERIVRDILIKYSNLTDKNKTSLGSLFKKFVAKSTGVEDVDNHDANKKIKISKKVSIEDQDEIVSETEEKEDSIEYSKSKVKKETLVGDLTESHDIDDTKETQRESEKTSKLKNVKATTEYVKPLKLKIKKKTKSQSDELVITQASKIKKKRKKPKNRVKLTHNVKYNRQSQSFEENKEESHLKKKKIKSGTKLTHITLYPVTIEINKKKKTKFRADQVVDDDDKSLELKSNEENSTVAEIIANHSIEINVVLNKESKEREDKLVAADEHTPLRFKFKKKTTSPISNELPTSASFEYFGSLHKDLPNNVATTKKGTDNTKVIKNIEATKDMKTVNKIDKLSARKTIAYNGEINRRANKATKDNNATKKMDDITKITTDINIVTLLPSIDNINDTGKSFAYNDSVNEIEHKEESNNYKVKPEVTTDNKKKANNLTNITTSATAAKIEETTFDINNYLKNSEIQNEDAEKKKEIEKLMRDDLKNLFSVATNATTTEGFTDVFKELEDAFDLN